MKNYTEINLNNQVKVKLTKRGRIIWLDYKVKLFKNATEETKRNFAQYFSNIENKARENGYYEFQLYEVMYIFGASASLAFEDNVISIDCPVVEVKPA